MNQFWMIPGAVNCKGLEMQGRNQKAVECCKGACLPPDPTLPSRAAAGRREEGKRKGKEVVGKREGGGKRQFSLFVAISHDNSKTLQVSFIEFV